jgi:hypothetical protein
MHRDITSGLMLIAGSVAFLLVMGLHPTGHDIMEQGGSTGAAHRSVLVHGLALAAAPVLFLGLLGFSRRLGFDHLTTAALVIYGFGVVAVMQAAVASGFVATPLILRMSDAQGTVRDALHAMMAYTHMTNQAFAMIHEVAFAAAILLWSAALLRSRDRLPMPLVTGIGGLAVGAGVLASLLSGRLHLDVRGMLILTFAKSLWMIWIGILLLRNSGQAEARLHT